MKVFNAVTSPPPPPEPKPCLAIDSDRKESLINDAVLAKDELIAISLPVINPKVVSCREDDIVPLGVVPDPNPADAADAEVINPSVSI